MFWVLPETRHEQLALGHVHTAYCGDRVREA